MPFARQVSDRINDDLESMVKEVDGVPGNKLAVLEFLSAQISVPAGQRILVTLTTWLHGAQVRHYLPFSPLGNAVIGTKSYQVFNISQLTRLYHHDASKKIAVSVTRFGGSGDVHVTMSLSGHLLDPPE